MTSDFESRIDALYDAVGSQDALARALMAFAPEFDTQGVVLVSHAADRSSAQVLAAGGVSDESVVRYQAHYAAEDEWLKVALARDQTAVDRAQIGSELVPIEALQKTRFWREFLLPYRQFDCVSCTLEMPGPTCDCTTYLAFVRSSSITAIPGHTKATLERLAPHFRRVLVLHRRLAPGLAVGLSLAELFERLSMPMLFVDMGGKLIEANSSARLILKQRGLLRLGAMGNLQVSDALRWQDLQPSLHRLASEPGFELTLERQMSDTTAADPVHILSVQRLHAAFTDALACLPASAVLSIRPATPQRDGPVLRQRFGLTEAELGVAQSLAIGLGPDAVANHLDVKISTVRTHIASLLAKTESTRQTEMRLPPNFGVHSSTPENAGRGARE